jgi:hypothetical protein
MSKQVEQIAVESDLAVKCQKVPQTVMLKQRPLWNAFLEHSIMCGRVKLLQKGYSLMYCLSVL